MQPGLSAAGPEGSRHASAPCLQGHPHLAVGVMLQLIASRADTGSWLARVLAPCPLVWLWLSCLPGVQCWGPPRGAWTGAPHACPMRATCVPGVGQRAGVGVTHVLPPDPEAAGPPHGSAWTLLPVLTPTYACTTGVQPRPGPWSQGLPEPHTALLLPPPLPSPPHASAASVYGRARTLCPSLVTPAGLQRVFVRGGVPLVPSRHWE